MKITAEIELRDDGILVVSEHGGRDRMVSLRPDGSVRTYEHDDADSRAGVRVHDPERLDRALRWLVGGARP